MKKIKTISTKNKMVANILRLLFSDDPVNRETGALAASGLGLVEPLHRHLHQNALELSQDAYKYYTIDGSISRDVSDILAKYQNARLALFTVMPAPYQSRQQSIFMHVNNVIFKYPSMQCRETPKRMGALVDYLTGWDFEHYLI